ncbi:MAG: hypothetical protein V1779_01050 [bacterium]
MSEIINTTNQGWIMLHRSLLDSQAFSNPELLKVWLWCLLKASHRQRWASMKAGTGFTEVEIKQGQFISGRKTASDELAMTESSVNNRMKKLVDMGNISIKANNHYSIITICNWEKYQNISFLSEQQDEQADNNNSTTTEQLFNTDNNVKNENNDKINTLFIDFVKLYPGRKRGVKTEFENFRKKHDDWLEVLPLLLTAIQKEESERQKAKQENKFFPAPKNLQTWINNRIWEEFSPENSINKSEYPKTEQKVNTIPVIYSETVKDLFKLSFGAKIITPDGRKWKKVSGVKFDEYDTSEDHDFLIKDFEIYYKSFTIINTKENGYGE